MPPHTRYVDVEGAAIAYQVVESEPPVDGGMDVVYITGAVSHVDVRWESPSAAQFLERLACLGRLILFDRRGTGASDPLPPDSTAGWEEWMHDLRVVLDAAGSEQAVLLATIDGGPTAIMFAATYPERATALVLGNTTARALVDEDYPQGMTPDLVSAFLELIATTWGTDAFARAMAPSLGAAESASFAKLQRASNTPRTAAERIRTDLLVDMREFLPLIHVPTLVIHSRGTQPINVEQGRYLAGHIPNAKMVELDSSESPLTFAIATEVAEHVEEFVTGSRRLSESSRMLATVVFTDIVGSTDRAAALGDRQWRQVLERHDELSRAAVTDFSGRVWKSTGDGVMATFDAPGRAIRCALSLRESLRTIDLDIRVGVHAGEVEVREEDISGLAVHIAARVLHALEGGGVMVSRTIADLVVGSDLQLDDQGTHVLKGVPGEWALFRVQP